MAAPLEQFEQGYRQLYTTESFRYDRARFSDSEGRLFDQDERAMIWRLLRAQPGQRVLDVAAGTGRIAAYLAERGLDVVACDLTTNMLRQARSRTDGRPHELACVGGNGRMLPFGDELFDTVISIRFLHLFPVSFHHAFVQEMWRVLRPGGTLLIQFDSALGGGGLALARELYRRLVRRHKPRYYLWPRQVPQVFAPIEATSLHGFSPFCGRFVRQIHAPSADRLEALLDEGPPSFLANYLFVRAVKPPAQLDGEPA